MAETISEGGRRDVELSNPAPTMLLGDFSATPDTLITIKSLIEERRWTGVGRKAHWWGGSLTSLHVIAILRRRGPELMASL